jgi:transposase InsO family protein
VEACSKLSISRPTLDKWLSRYKRFGEEGLFPQKRKKYKSPQNRTSEKIEDIVIEMAQKYWNDGVETLSDRIFEEHKELLHSTTIYRILKRRGERYTGRYNGTKKRVKKQLYAHKEAGKELQMDTKYPFGYKVGVVAYTVIDDASRWVFAKMYSTANAKNTVDFLNELGKRAPFDIQKIRTDCGTEFVNQKAIQAFLDQGIEHRQNTPYCPEENGKIERFHRTLNEKAIFVSWAPQDSLQTLQYKLEIFLHWYNFKKRHRGLGMDGLTPFQKLCLMASQENVNLTLQCNNA